MKVTSVDVAASALARLSPRRLGPRIDQLRHDVNGLLGGFSGRRPPPFSGPAHPAPRPLALRDIDPVEHLLPGRALRRRWVTLRTDLSWLARDLRGQARPATVARGPSRYRAAADRLARAEALSPRPVLVREVVRETADAATLRLDEADGRPFTFEAGQFLTFHLVVDGEPLRRAYSLSSSPLDGPGATVTVKRVEGGRASTWMQSLTPGARLAVLGPSGNFVARPDERRLALIAGGSGITPVASILETALRAHPDAEVHLLYGNRRAEDVIFRARLDALAARFGERLVVEHALEEPPPGWTGRVGRLDGEAVASWARALGPMDAYFLCGPGPMMDAARAALEDLGVAPGRVREERFQSPGASPAPALPDGPVPVQLSVGGRRFALSVAPGQTLLEAGLAAGASMPFSCAMGGCAACKGRLVDGDVAMDEPNCLTPAERDAGAVLTCCARPLGPASLEVG